MSTSTTTGNPVTWFEIHASDRARSRSFYESALGWTFREEAPGYDMIGMGESAPIGGGLTAARAADSPRAIFNVQVEDVEAVCAAVEEAGGTIVEPMATTPTGLDYAYVADPDGSVFGLWKPGS